ncbi:helix-hairpin-helix domain-containing protein [Nocardiopsis ansamitocini]|uniref:Uncharacterized protein n=1 Tax=Nocardiopsis ansamitocini TaxID=1670832 RepID=A0A9W6UJN1_9ACTN|nr:helix-hairpin-helix domain-containing protein [Nocardiopsis ansamitocini]GLU48887.1 hypothetical protein Nans01_32380 [Nocardiopsis ansamitocini]
MVDPSSPPPPAAADDAAEGTRQVLARMGAPAELAPRLVAVFGPTAAHELTADPWRLLELPAVTVQQADFCARTLLGDAAHPDDPRRGRALVAHLLRRAARSGHTALAEARVAGALRDQQVRSVDAAMSAATDGPHVQLVEVFPDSADDDEFGEDSPEMPDAERFLALDGLGLAEQQLGEGLLRLISAEPIMDSATAVETVQAAAASLDRELLPETAAAMVTVALRGVSVLVHGAGSHATIADAVRYASAIAEESQVGLVVAAPTASGAAALNLRLADSAVRAGTVAGLLDAGGPGEAGLVVLTDATALDTETAAALVAACGDDTHLVLVADPGLLPSVGPGQLVDDLITSRVAAVAVLPGDPAPGPQVLLAAEVADGRFDPTDVHAPDREVVVVPAASAGEAAHRAVQLITDAVPRAFGIAAEHVQIITAERTGEAGSDAVNAACKAHFNPGPGAVAGLDPGDRVLLAGSGPGYLPGDAGVLGAVGEKGAAVELVDGRTVTVSVPAHLRPGWAITVPAAQGGTWPAAILVYGPDAPVSRAQFYTALTRGESHVCVVTANAPALSGAVRDATAPERHTRLVQILRES